MTKVSTKEPLRVLVIDDDPVDLQVLTRLFAKQTRWDVKLEAYQDLAEALDSIRHNDYDVALVDYHLGAWNGTDILRKVREGRASFPVIVISGQGDEQTAAEVLRNGAADYFPKDRLSPQALLRTIGNALEKFRLGKSIEDHREELEHAVEDLNRKNEEINSFYHNVAHELKTPLTGIREFIALIADRLVGPVTNEQDGLLRSALRNCDRMTTCIDDMLDASRADTGKLQINRSFRTVAELFRELDTEWTERLKSRGLGFRCELRGSHDPVFVDGKRIAQVFSNLIGNAEKFTESGGWITVIAQCDGDSPGFTRFSVHDTGRGIPAEMQSRLFDRLFQSNTADAALQGGLGLGLSIVKQLIELHGGKIWVKSEVDRGSVFHFTLPNFELRHSAETPRLRLLPVA